MRTLVDVPDEYLRALGCIAKKENVSRAAIIREAIVDYVKTHAEDQSDAAFGLWGNKKTDGLKYQKKIRSEWDDE